jgi:hypothetical protein
MTGSASQLSGAFQKTLGFAQPVPLMCNLKIRVLPLRHIERNPEVSERLAGQVREWPAVETLQGLRQKAARRFEMALEADLHFAFGT